MKRQRSSNACQAHRYALIIAGGSGTRLWPMSRAALPKQLIPFIRPRPEDPGRSLLQIAVDRLVGLVEPRRRYICAGQTHQKAVLHALDGFAADRFLAEPMGRDTLNAVGLGAAVIAQRDPQAVIAVFTADHVIEPIDRFQQIVRQGFAVAESLPNALVTFGITPTHAATGYGYLALGDALSPRPGLDRSTPAPSTPAPSGRDLFAPMASARVVRQFKEKPDAPTAQQYFTAGADQYLWNSGMFVWRAETLLDCIGRYHPENHAGLLRIAAAWDSPRRRKVLAQVYPTLKKISVDYAVMEPASKDPAVTVAAVPMDLAWLDVGSWPSFALTCAQDEQGNRMGGGHCALIDSRNTLVASNDPDHLITVIGGEDLIVVHTPAATLVCRADRAEDIKKLHALVGAKFGAELL